MPRAAAAAADKPKVDHSAMSGGPPLQPPPNPGDGANAILDKFAPMPAPAAPEIIKGRQVTPPRILLYGTEGIGKSTLASKAEKPIFIQTEDGLQQIDCDKFQLSTTYEDVVEKLRYACTGGHAYQSVVIDSLDWLERLIWAHVCQRNNSVNIERVGGGFAKGYMYALDEWKEIIDLLAKCHIRGMVVILLAHAKIERFEDPESPAYDRYSPRLHKHAQALIVEWTDAVLFATRKMSVRTEGAGFNERGVAVPVGAGGGERIIRCVGSPACVAKNRYSMPAELPLAWDSIVASLASFMNQPKGA